ncbi:MAG: SxtJ family membrane protein [Bacteroidales bacterium]|nr:SxtJ family membrane protein [Bacteroidales bacterium]
MRKTFSKKENQDAGLALLLLILLIKILGNITLPDTLLLTLLLIALLIPKIFFPFSFLWYNLSDLLGHIASFIFLNVVYWIFVVPMALVRKLLGKDPLKLKKFKKGDESVFHERNYTFTPKDMSNTF